ncbi:MAG: molecular chaperone DnaJ [Deferribacteres bacterium]|nr:molecular chaperone DnaJ [candidate division KSB1 bacterium]MCB9511902.1 molecular chaperone DnaJ [Deferribacteres bacterium]
MTKRDYYEILGLSRDAGDDDVKKAYRKLAMQYHPDRNPGDKEAEERFKEASEAYEILKDPQKRQRYDAYGHAGVKGGYDSFAGFDFDLSDALRTFMSEGIFGDFFGAGAGRGQGRRRAQQRGSDLQLRIALTLEEIASGVTKKIKLRKLIKCDTCSGSGATQGSQPINCTACGGTGEIRNVSRSFFGQFVNVSTCPQCHGEGKVIKDPCVSCHGEGRIKGEGTIEVTIPAGVSTGNYMTIRNEGNAGPRGGAPGDAILLIEEKEHKAFDRHGDDILYDLILSFPQLALGDNVEIPTLKGKAELDIAPGTQVGKILRMKGKGIPHLKGHGSGDQLVRVMVWTPTKLSAKEKDLLKELAQAENFVPPKSAKGIFEKIKEVFS